MRDIFKRIDERRDLLLDHPFFIEARELQVGGVAEKLRVWGPLFVHLSMTFRDVNRMYYAYPSPRSELEAAINAHAQVDATHWRLLVDDLAAIGVNHQVASYGEAMESIWSDFGSPVRDYMYGVLNRAQRCGSSPFLRMTAMESGEATVKMFFSVTRHVAALFEVETGKKLHYFGESHIESEVDNAVGRDAFDPLMLDPYTQRRGRAIVDEHFDKFEEFLDFKFSISFAEE